MQTVQAAIQDYLRDLAVGQSKQTVATYSQGLHRFSEFLDQAGLSPTVPVSNLCVEHALEFARWLTQERAETVGAIAKVTLRTYLSSVSRFYAYLLRHKFIELSASDLETMRESFRLYRRGYSRPLPKLPPEEAIESLLEAAKAVKPHGKNPRLDLARLRNIAMLEALRSSGMRVGELVGLVRDNLDYRQHSALVTGKGSKERIVYFDDSAWQAIQTYLKARADGAKGRALYLLPVFARHDRRSGTRTFPISTDTVRLVFDQLADAAGIEINMTPHSLRHAFATRVLEATGDLAVVQDMLGHASPATTRIYAKVSSKRQRQAHRTAFGYNRRDEPRDDSQEP